MAILIEKLKREDEKNWDKFVSSHKLATMYHLLGWRGVIKETYQLEDIYLVAKEKDKIVGIFPSFLIKNPLGNKKIISLPYCNYGGPISEDKKINHLFLNYLKNKYQIKDGEIRSLQDEYKLPFKKGYVTSILNLKMGEKNIWENLSEEKIRNIHKAEKNSLNIRVGQNLIADFYSLYGKTMKRLGTPCHGIKFFQNIIKSFPKQSNVFMVYYQKVPVASLFSFIFKKTFYDPWVASDNQYFYLRPNDFLYWKAIEWACQNHLSSFDLGRSTENSGVHKFKKQWGAKTIPLFYYSLSLKKTGQNFPQAQKIFSKSWLILPLFITNKLGPFLRKYIP